MSIVISIVPVIVIAIVVLVVIEVMMMIISFHPHEGIQVEGNLILLHRTFVLITKYNQRANNKQYTLE
jgi:hypothetical protein